MKQFNQWGFQAGDQKLVDKVLTEWFSAGTVENILTKRQSLSPTEKQKVQTPLNIFCYNVQGWGSGSLEIIDIVYEVEASICVFTEVGELWNTSRVPHFNIFYQHGINKSGSVCVAIGKHLKASRVYFNVENTVIVDVNGLSETIRIIAIYWPVGQSRKLEELQPYTIENTIIAGDFNASVIEWSNASSDKRGRSLKEWIEKIIFITRHQHHIHRNVRIGILI